MPRCATAEPAKNRMMDVETAWNLYKRNRDSGARERLIFEFLSLVKYVAGRLAVVLPPTVQMEDLVSSGVIGLIDAIEKFDPCRDTRFKTYAIMRIRGAILDELRSLDWVPRSTRRKARQLEETYAELERELGRAASDEEVAGRLRISRKAFCALLAEISSACLLSLDGFVSHVDGDETTRMGDNLSDPRGIEPSWRLEGMEIRDLLVKAIEGLPERERDVIALYYYEELTLREIGSMLNVSESRVCQIHTKAILRLRGRLRYQQESLMAAYSDGIMAESGRGEPRRPHHGASLAGAVAVL
jgi:RNA polymerase sigma factor for flagellar operon FliA